MHRADCVICRGDSKTFIRRLSEIEKWLPRTTPLIISRGLSHDVYHDECHARGHELTSCGGSKKFGILKALVSVSMLNESSVTGDATGAPLSFQSGISSSSPRGSNTFPAEGNHRHGTDPAMMHTRKHDEIRTGISDEVGWLNLIMLNSSRGTSDKRPGAGVDCMLESVACTSPQRRTITKSTGGSMHDLTHLLLDVSAGCGSNFRLLLL